MPGGELVAAGVFGDRAADLMDARVELVDHRQDERLDRPRLDGRAVLARAVMRHDQVLDLRAKIVGKARDAVDRLAHHDQPEADVADEVAVARVGARRRLVVQFLQLADVVEQHAGEHDIFVARRSARASWRADVRHLQLVLEQPAAIGVMNALRRRPLAQLGLVIGDDAIEQHADVRIAHRLEVRRQLAPHLVDRARRRQHAVFLAKSLQPILRRVDAPDVRHRQLQLALEVVPCASTRTNSPASNSSLNRSMSSTSLAGI